MTPLTLTFLLTFAANLFYAQANVFDTTLIMNKQKISIRTKTLNNEQQLLTSVCQSKTTFIDTIYTEGLAYIKYPDFNKDGYADILMDYFGNNSTYYLYLFNPATNKFVSIANYSNFPDAVQLKSNPNYYYSYHRAGCADANWVSDLFKITNFKIIHLAHIDGNGCAADLNESPQIIKIYKVLDSNEEKEKLIENLSYLKAIPSFSDKWDFIKKYWNTNYIKFL